MNRSRGILWDLLCLGTGVGCIIWVVTGARLVLALEGDNCAQTYALFVGAMRQGEINLWNPYLWGGFPNAGNFITESGYPINWILCRLFYQGESGLVSYAVIPGNLIFHLSVYFSGMYFLLKRIGFSRLNSFSVGVTSTLCCSMFSYMYWLVYLAGFSWLPYIILCAIVMFESGRGEKGKYSVILGILFALEASISVSLMLVISVIIFGLLFLAYLFGTDRKRIRENFLYSILSGVLGIGLAAPLLLSSLTFMRHMVRYVPDLGYVTWGTALPLSEYTKHVCEPSQIWQMLDFHNNADAELPEISRLSVSAFTLLFCAAGLFCRDKQNRKLYYLSFFGFVICLMACFGIVFPAAFYYIPGLNQLREAILYGILVNMFAGILAAYGFNEAERIIAGRIFAGEGYGRRILSAIVLTLLLTYNLLIENTMCRLFAGLGLCLWGLTVLKRIRGRKILFICCSLLFAGLCVKDVYDVMNIFAYTEPEAVEMVGEACENSRMLLKYVEGLEPEDEYFRMTGWGHTAAYPENMASVLGFYDVKGYLNPSLASGINIHTMLPLEKRAQLQNIKYYLVNARDNQDVIERFDEDRAYRKVGEVEGIYSDWAGTNRDTVYVYRVEENQGDAWVTADVEWNDTASQEEILQRIAEGELDISAVAVAERCELTDRERDILEEAGRRNTGSEALCSEVSHNRIVYEVNSGSGGILVTAEMYYPGWEVLVNGVKGTLLQVDGTNRGAVVPKGESVVEFRFRPAEIRAGAFLQLAAAGIMCTVLGRKKFLYFFHKRRKERG